MSLNSLGRGLSETIILPGIQVGSVTDERYDPVILSVGRMAQRMNRLYMSYCCGLLRRAFL